MRIQNFHLQAFIRKSSKGFATFEDTILEQLRIVRLQIANWLCQTPVILNQPLTILH